VFERFLSRYPLPQGNAGEVWADEALMAVAGYAEFAQKAAGLPLCGGLLRVVTASEGKSATDFLREGFPEYADRAVPFAVDWIGRVVAVDRARPPGLLLIEPGSADAYEIDESLVDYFDRDVVDESDVFLATDLFEDWKAAGGEAPPAGSCVGFKVPLFLGGTGSAQNLEVSDLEVYWSITAQLRTSTRGLAPGTQVGEIDIR
jgi:hypothetical protein